MLNKECQAGTEAQQRTDDEVNSSSHTIGKPNVVCSQSPPSDFNAFDLLDTICNGLIAFKSDMPCKELYKVKTTLELPTESYNRVVDFLKEKCPTGFDEKNILYAGFKFCVQQIK